MKKTTSKARGLVVLPRVVGAAARAGIVALAVLLAACPASLTTDQKLARAVVVLNDFQDAAAKAYDDAKTVESAAGNACRTAARGAGVTLPTVAPPSGEEFRKACSALGAPIPFDPYKLQDLATPINATYDGVRLVNSARVAVKEGKSGDVVGALRSAGVAVRSLIAGASEVGITLPSAILSALEALGL